MIYNNFINRPKFCWGDLIFVSVLTIIVIISLSLFSEVNDFAKYKEPEYATFKFYDFVKWYNLTPEKFIFDIDKLYVYYLHADSDTIDKNETRYNCELDGLDTTIMYPETFIDYCHFCSFIDKIYTQLEKAEKNKEAEEAKIKANNDMVRVMNSLKKDINNILEENDAAIKAELEKINNLKE